MATRGLLGTPTVSRSQASTSAGRGGLLALPIDTAPQIDPDDPKRSVGQWFGEMVLNIPGSGLQFAKDITGLLRPSTWQALGQLTQDEEMRSEVWGYMKDRYGGVDELLDSMREDPVGIFSDAVGAVSAGSLLAGKLPPSGAVGQAAAVGRISQVARAVGNVADIVDPTNLAVRATTGIVKDVIPSISGGLAGVSPATVRQWVRTGAQGGKAQRDFNRIISSLSVDDMGSMVTRLRTGLDQVRAKRATDYQEAMAGLNKAVETVDIAPLITKLDELETARTLTDDAGGNVWLPNDPREAAFAQLRAMAEAADGLPPSIDNIDQLKQAINSLYSPTDPGVSQIVTEAYNLVKEQIAAQAPEYTQIMADYTKASDNIFDLEREFRLQNKATDPAVFSRALSTTRDQVNTHFGGRHQLLLQLDEGVFSDLAAAAGHPMAPTGMRGSGSGLHGVTQVAEGLATGDPSNMLQAVMPMVAMSPRVNARVANATGQLGGAPRRLVNRAPQQFQDVLAGAENLAGRPTNAVPGRFTGSRNPLSAESYIHPTRGQATLGEIPLRASAAAARATRPIMRPLSADMSSGALLPGRGPEGLDIRDFTTEERQEFESWLYGGGR